MVFMFHQVNDKKTAFYPAMSVAAFKDLCMFIEKNYAVINPSQIKAHFSKSNKPAAIISFDDGHYDIIQHALPILSALKLPFNVNIDTEILDTGRPQDFVRVYDILNHSSLESFKSQKFMDQPIEIDRGNPMKAENEFTEVLSNLSPEQKREFTDELLTQAELDFDPFSKMLSKEDLKELQQYNVEFGSHSHTHAILPKAGPEQIRHELSHSKQVLENTLNSDISVLAYPNGKFNDKVKAMAQDIGYTIFLETDDLINVVSAHNKTQDSYKRINQYHQNMSEALAHTYGIIKMIKKLKG